MLERNANAHAQCYHITRNETVLSNSIIHFKMDTLLLFCEFFAILSFLKFRQKNLIKRIFALVSFEIY